MTTHHYDQAPQRKMSSLLITGVLHAIALGLGLQATNVIDLRPPTIVELTQIVPPPKPLEPEPKHALPKTLPPIAVMEPPILKIDREPTNHITVEVRDKVDPVVKERSASSNNGPTTSEASPPRTPIHIAAQVDANACDKPEYPASSIRVGEEGTVNLAMLIGADGRVLESKVEKSSGSRALDKAAVQGLSLCKFKPGTIDGVPEKSWAKLQYVWTIN